MNNLFVRPLAALKTYQLPILAGLFIGTTYIPFFPWALVFCISPLWIFWIRNRDSYKKLWIGSWLTQFILNLIGFHWVAHTTTEFGGFPSIVSYLILLLFAAVAHLYYPLAAIVWAWCSRKVPEKWSWVLIPIAFALMESINPTIFFWHLGYPWLWINLPGAHMAEWIGFYGLNIITLFLNLAVVLFVIYRRKAVLISAVAVFAIVNGTGWLLKSRAQEATQKMPEFNVLIVQANIGNAMKAEQDKGAYFHDFILRKYLEITDSGLRANPKTDLIVWPETAFPSQVRSGNSIDGFQNKLRYSVATMNIPLLSGAYERDDQNFVYNSLVHFDQKGQFVDSYRKTHLLAFGEYFPGAGYYPKLKEWFPMVSDFGRGLGPKTMAINNIRFGSQICYESLFDGFSKSLIDEGAQVIVNITNDSWFGKHAEPYQHGYMTLARALEFRVPLVRSTNTGISTVILSDGTIGEQSPLHKEWSGHYTVKYPNETPRTVYSYYAGNWPIILFVLFFIVFIGGLVGKTRKP